MAIEPFSPRDLEHIVLYIVRIASRRNYLTLDWLIAMIRANYPGALGLENARELGRIMVRTTTTRPDGIIVLKREYDPSVTENAWNGRIAPRPVPIPDVPIENLPEAMNNLALS